MKRTGNLLEEVSQAQGQETYETLLECGSVRIERIVSFGHASQEGFWYDQAEDEWVVLLEGAAILEDAEGTRLLLKPGDTVWLPAGLKHRVAWTPKTQTNAMAGCFQPARLSLKQERRLSAAAPSIA
ncbi:MAG: cupin domain-containing protein [Nitrospirota bacterium]|nr:cupin domain-containing protein [Nitrospirota bacterium]